MVTVTKLDGVPVKSSEKKREVLTEPAVKAGSE